MDHSKVADGEVARGELTFTIESRLIRELGERLVRQPEVALLELIKNAYDADAERCCVLVEDGRIRVLDNGTGMTLDEFTNGWMRIGTSSKGSRSTSRLYGRPITGEKGIGRFAVRYLGQRLVLATVAWDETIGAMTRLVAVFDWTEFDRNEDLGSVKVPFRLTRVADSSLPGTVLSIGRLRAAASKVDWKDLRTGSIGVVSPIRSLLGEPSSDSNAADKGDPGFKLVAGPQDGDGDVADEVLRHYALRATVKVEKDVLRAEVYRGTSDAPYLTIVDSIGSELDGTSADIRFYPRREGLFSKAGVDGRKAYTWIRENSGVKVFDRGFQMRPYGMTGDDWLALGADTERNLREPISAVMRKHYPMDQPTKSNTALNWMLRLPSNLQLVGVVQVQGRRISEGQETGLIAAADREGFIENQTFADLKDIVRGAVEAMAYADREISLQLERLAAEARLAKARAETEATIKEIEGETAFSPQQRTRIIGIIQDTQERSEKLRLGEKEREQQLEIMSLLGVVAGFMTHEFGVALSELRSARDELRELAATVPGFIEKAKAFDDHIEALNGFVRYSRAYIEGVRSFADKPYPARPRFMHVAKAFSDYSGKRRIDVRIEVDPDVMAPSVPPALYDGIAQNLLTNALKSLTSSDSEEKVVVFRAWNDGRWHRMQVSDTGTGIPQSIRDLVFDPLFTTTNKKSSDPLGSGMGLGLALVRRGAKAFGGSAELVDPPPGFATCVEVSFPRDTE